MLCCPPLPLTPVTSVCSPHMQAKSKEKLDAQAAARQDATLVLMKELPTLLKKLQTDPAQVHLPAPCLAPLLQQKQYTGPAQPRCLPKLGWQLPSLCLLLLVSCLAAGFSRQKLAPWAQPRFADRHHRGYRRSKNVP